MMPHVGKRKPPLPLALSFLACNDIFKDSRTGAAILVGPTSHVPIPEFPATVRLSLFAEFTGGHGSYLPGFALIDTNEQTVWEWRTELPFEQSDPLLPREVIFYDVMVSIPRAGRYQLVMFLNSDEATQRGMWFGPAELFRS